MRILIVGLGNQGKKRRDLLNTDVVGTVDPYVSDAQYKNIGDISLDDYDAAFVCTPDESKLDTLHYLLSHGKHVLVEKPLLADDGADIRKLEEVSRRQGVVLYTAYNHRFEPHMGHLKALLDSDTLGQIYLARFFYGNGTAQEVKRSPWRDRGIGVLADIGSHLLDWVLFLFGKPEGSFEIWSSSYFENQACDHVLFGVTGRPTLELEAALISWRNTLKVDVYGEQGSAHVDCLCKWGRSTFTVRKRVYPSGKPEEKVQTLDQADPTWNLEHEHFKRLCREGNTNVENDVWINAVLKDLNPEICD